MQKELVLQVSPETAAVSAKLKQSISKILNVPEAEIFHIEVLRRSIDARQKVIKINLKVLIFINETFTPTTATISKYQNISASEPVIIIGAGPAGLFAALRLIELGKKPVILERGKDVRERRKDLVAINRFATVNEDCNYCFGEGGAGTYSDGKLYTRSKKRGDVQQILETFVAHGASGNIMIDAHPHIGTNKLPQIITKIRQTILKNGGEIHFKQRVTDLKIEKNSVTGVTTHTGDSFNASNIILATGHSARDIFELLQSKGIAIEAKPFALGVRVEHSQKLIDTIQYKCVTRSDYLPPAPYSIVRQVSGRGVYSFCMCPGGIIAPCATTQQEVVVNGWSPSNRNQPNANSGIVVELKLEDFEHLKEFGELRAMEFQKRLEHKAWQLAGKTQKVPAQRLVDFINDKLSADIPVTSYYPGTNSVRLSELFPAFIYENLVEGFRQFGEAMPGYLNNEAVVHAPESRTSSPVRIPRDKQSLQHPYVKGLYPCGEGAGYAGGIISAAIDGEKCADMIAKS